MINFKYFDQKGSLDEYDVLLTILAYFDIYLAKQVAKLLFIEEDELVGILRYHNDHKDIKQFIDVAELNKDLFFKEYFDFLGDDFIKKDEILKILNAQ
jgi:hypothetical protein